MRLTRLWLTDFRNYDSAEVELPAGLTVIVGDNGAGKTNLLEAVGYLATLESFRGAPGEALVRQGSERAVVRGEASREADPRGTGTCSSRPRSGCGAGDGWRSTANPSGGRPTWWGRWW